MKKYILAVTCIILAVCSACNDDDDKAASLNGTYSNIGSYQGENHLFLFYGGTEEIGKDVFFSTSDGKKARIILDDIIPGQPTTEFNDVPLQGDSHLYGFTASEEKQGWRIEIEGEVMKGKLTIHVKAKMPSNEWTGTWNLAKKPLSLTWEATTPIQVDLMGTGKPISMPVSAVAPLVATMLGERITAVLQSITFKEDGNILAIYKNGQDENEVWQESPANLVKFYVKENKLYVCLNAYMIQQTVNARQTRLNWEQWEPLILKLQQWALYGIPLDYTVTNQTGKIFINAGDLANPLGEILSTLLPLLGNMENLNELLKSILDQLPAILQNTTKLEVGLNLVQTPEK